MKYTKRNDIRILIGTPFYRTVHPQFVTSLMNMILSSIKIAQCTHVFVQGTNASRQRNALVKSAIADGYDYLLTIDSDMVFPFGALASFLSVGMPVVGGVYTGRLEGNRDLLMVFKKDAVREEGMFYHYSTKEELPSVESPFKVEGVGSGFLLMRKDILTYMLSDDIVSKIGLPFAFWPIAGRDPLGPDLSFCHRLNLCGIDMWVDPRPKLGHIFEDVKYPEEEV